MNHIIQFFRKELSYFQVLTKDQRVLLLSFVLYSTAAPLLLVFLETFVWRQTRDPLLLIEYNVAFPVGIIATFALNGFLLNYFRIRTLYTLGCIAQALAPLTFLFFGEGMTSVGYFMFFSLLNGLAGGLYWANRNTIASHASQGARRFQFMSLDSALSTMTSAALPVLIGWCIILGERSGFVHVGVAYRFFGIIGACCLVVSGIITLWIAEEVHVPIKMKGLFLKAPNRRWQKVRFVEFLSGLVEGASTYFPVLLILLLIGQENVVGSVQSVTAVLSTAAMYLLGRVIQPRYYIRILTFWFALTTIGAVILGFSYTAWALLVYLAFSAFSIELRYSTLFTIFFDIVDEEIQKSGVNRFVYLLDREFFLGAGRVTILIALALGYIYFPAETLRFGLLGVILTQLPLLFTVRSVLQKSNNQ